MTTAPPIRPLARPRPAPQPTLAWQVILTAVVSSVLILVVMFMGLSHFSTPAGGSKPASTLVGPSQVKVPTMGGSHAGPADDGTPAGAEADAEADVSNQASAGATSVYSAGATTVLNMIKALRESGKDFVSGQTHRGLNDDLRRLESAAEKVAQNPTFGLIVGYAAALDQAISRADQISQRPTETSVAIALATQLKNSLKHIRSTLPYSTRP